MSLKHRVKKLEQKSTTNDNPVTKIVFRLIAADRKVSSTMIKTLIDGVWCIQTKSNN